MKTSIQKLKSFSRGYIYNSKGWRTNRKIVVIESDDWGGERTPSKETYLKLINAGIQVDKCPFGKYDTIESQTDLEGLFEVLSSVKDKRNKPAIATANFNLANPDYQKIQENSYEDYFYIDYRATLDKYNRNQVLETIKEGIGNEVFFPQNHSREHLSPYIWLDEIKSGNKSLKKAFDLQVYGVSRVTSPEIVKYHLASQLYRNPQELEFVSETMRDGARLFKSYFGYKSESFIAPVYTWNDENEKIMLQNGVKYIQSSFYQNYFNPFKIESFKRKYHYTGQLNKNNQLYTVRNCLFEPSLNHNVDWVSRCISEIKVSFLMKKPVVISTHRLNYIGGLVEENRTTNLKLLKELLIEITRKWPNVEFMTSVELGKLIYNENNFQIH
jgi:hypothetical protein